MYTAGQYDEKIHFDTDMYLMRNLIIGKNNKKRRRVPNHLNNQLKNLEIKFFV